MDLSINRTSMITNMRLILPMIIVAGFSLFFDQLTKTIVRNTVATIDRIEVIKGFFEIYYAENTGAVFGMFHGMNFVFIIISIIAIVFMFVYYLQFKYNIWMKLALGFLLGGALGNLVDRIIFGHVTDFIRVRWWFLHLRWWPIFNIADTVVVIGASMLILGMIRMNYKE